MTSCLRENKTKDYLFSTLSFTLYFSSSSSLLPEIKAKNTENKKGYPVQDFALLSGLLSSIEPFLYLTHPLCSDC
jgi:hypothetical protein